MNRDSSYYYRILGLKPGASQVEIKSAYRRLVKLYHPDMCKSSDSMAMYKEVRTAYDKLSNWDYSSITDIKTATKTATKTGTGTKSNTGTTSSHYSSYSKWDSVDWENLEKSRSKDSRKIMFLSLKFCAFCLAVMSCLPSVFLIATSYHIVAWISFTLFLRDYIPSRWSFTNIFLTGIQYGITLIILLACFDAIEGANFIYSGITSAASAWVFLVYIAYDKF